MNNSKPTQCTMLISRMLDGERFTQQKALRELGVGRLTSRVYEIRTKHHYPVKDRMITVKNQFGEECHVKEYWIE